MHVLRKAFDMRKAPWTHGTGVLDRKHAQDLWARVALNNNPAGGPLLTDAGKLALFSGLPMEQVLRLTQNQTRDLWESNNKAIDALQKGATEQVTVDLER
jgi:hypothetical protein